MDKIKQWALIISAVSIVSGILLSLIPKGNLKPAFKTLSTVILVYAFFFPLIDINGVDFNIGEYLSDNYELSESLDKYAEQSIINSAEKAVEDLLTDSAEKEGINCKIKVTCDVMDSEMIISNITVRGEVSEEEKKTIRQIGSELGLDEAVIEFVGEADEH